LTACIPTLIDVMADSLEEKNMKKAALFMAVLLAVPCFAKPKSRQKGTLPPIVSHGEKISRYGCDIMLLPNSHRSTTRWALTVWAEYGNHEKRYWETFLGRYGNKPGVRVIESLGEPAWKGGPVGPIVVSFGTPGANKACADWGDRVRAELMPKRHGR
jgi:hypothetical protein